MVLSPCLFAPRTSAGAAKARADALPPRTSSGTGRVWISPKGKGVLLHMLTAVDGDVGARHEGSFFGGQVDDQPGDFLGLAEPADRDVRQDLGVQYFLRNGRDHLCSDVTW